MKIKNSKFDINDNVWLIHPRTQQCIESKITEIAIRIQSNKITKAGDRRDLIFTGEYGVGKINYSYHVILKNGIKEDMWRDESQVFLSKKELISSL